MNRIDHMIVAVDTNSILPGRVGGIENYTLGLVEALQSPNSPAKKLYLLTRPENHERFSPFANAQTEIIPVPRPAGNWTEIQTRDPGALAKFQAEKSALLRRLAVELVHFPGNTINPLELDLPIVLNLHDLQHRRFPEYFPVDEIVTREKWWIASGQRADALLAASSFVRDDLAIQLKVDRAKIFVAPDAFESAFFRPPPSDQLDALKAKYDLPKTFFIYPAAAWPHKNHARLIEAFQLAEIPDAQLLLTGAGQESLNTHDVPGVRLLGRVSTEDLVALYHLATALIFPSLYEAWSIPIMEAMAAGCPVASSNVTSLPEQVADAGLLFDPTDIYAMANAMRRLAGNSSLRQRLAARGALRVRQFSRENYLQTLRQAYGFARRAHQAKKAA